MQSFEQINYPAAAFVVGTDVGEKVLVPYLLDNTNGIIDIIIVSHFHDDHVEGLISVLNNLKVSTIYPSPCY